MRTKFKFHALSKIFKDSSDRAKKYGMKAEFIMSYKAARRIKRLLVTPQTFGYNNLPIDLSCYIALDEWDL